MKKFLFLFVPLVFVSTVLKAQSEDDDRDWRFGLRITPQPLWFASGNNSNIPKGLKFGYGFGLDVEYRFNNTVSLRMGIGGDFEGGKYTLKDDNNNNFHAHYYKNESNELVNPTDGKKNGNTLCYLKERNVNTTFVSVPVLLKLSTKEISGLKFYGMFGFEIGVRAQTTATDIYNETGKYANDTTYTKLTDETSEKGVHIGKDASLIPMRVGFNAGLGVEYRLSGSTAAFFNVNFFRALTPLMRQESKYLYYATEQKSDGTDAFYFVQQKLFQTALRVSLGIMF